MGGYSVTRTSKIDGKKITIKKNASEVYFMQLMNRAKNRNMLTFANAQMDTFETEKFIYKYEFLAEFDFFD